jgi:3-mercaptopyruvate sulfurtransferase SseA
MSAGPLVTTAWLHDHLDDDNMRIVDIRGHVLPPNAPPPHYFNHYEDYLVSHIPGAVFVDWVYEITDPTDLHHARIAPPARFAEVMARRGISDQTFVVAYDDAGSMFAARLWWALNYYGHTRVAVLDGGWNKWAEGRPVTDALPTIAPAAFTARPQPAWVRTGDQVMARLGTSTRLIDVRTPPGVQRRMVARCAIWPYPRCSQPAARLVGEPRWHADQPGATTSEVGSAGDSRSGRRVRDLLQRRCEAERSAYCAAGSRFP